MTQLRALRVFLLANDGFSAGHVARTIAVARALARRSRARDISVQMLLATTSEADALLSDDTFLVVRMPAPVASRRAGFADSERRRIVRGVLEGALGAFAPDLVVCDTFPSGPHGELGGLDMGRAKRALVRRAVPNERVEDEALSAGLQGYDVVIVADDAGFADAPLPVPAIRVPPITIAEARDGKSRADARAALELPADGRVVVVASGGGGDHEAVERAIDLAEAVARLAPETTVVRAVGPLEEVSRRRSNAVRAVEIAPLQPMLAAFDGAFAAAGYNTAHELAKAGVPAALFSRPRPFDDQAARAERFSRAGMAYRLDRFDDGAISAALGWMTTARPPRLEADGADRAADVLIDLVTGKLSTKERTSR